MKTFKDLEFYPHEVGAGTHAIMEFNNGYGVSVVSGTLFYSNGIDTYEVAILHNGHITYSTDITADVLGWQTECQVSEIMRRVQKLK